MRHRLALTSTLLIGASVSALASAAMPGEPQSSQIMRRFIDAIHRSDEKAFQALLAAGTKQSVKSYQFGDACTFHGGSFHNYGFQVVYRCGPQDFQVSVGVLKGKIVNLQTLRLYITIPPAPPAPPAPSSNRRP